MEQQLPSSCMVLFVDGGRLALARKGKAGEMRGEVLAGGRKGGRGKGGR